MIFSRFLNCQFFDLPQKGLDRIKISGRFRVICILFFQLLFLSWRSFAFEPCLRIVDGSEYGFGDVKPSEVLFAKLIVPENWNEPNGRRIELAVARIRSLSPGGSRNPIVFLQGGPGGSSLGGVKRWMQHPVRQICDIVLVDLRGTGFSRPSLCPELGKEMLQILAKNQNELRDTQDKVKAALSCKDQLIQRGINFSEYNSNSVAKDLHALLAALKLQKWNVYGLSYGTQFAQVYSETYPTEVGSLVLDSPISVVSEYFERNTENFARSLNYFFESCRNNPHCNSAYPNLELVFYETSKMLSHRPITVNVDKEIVGAGKFTYNEADFKMAVQQSLYKKNLIEVLPAIIYSFYRRDVGVLANFTSAFSSALSLDYGTYYCVTCDEVITSKSLSGFVENSSKFPKLNNGLAFYRSDYDVCKAWTNKSNFARSQESSRRGNRYPVLVFTGRADPITPSSNANQLAGIFDRFSQIVFTTQGHASSFSTDGREIVRDFLRDPRSFPALPTEKDGQFAFVEGISSHSAVANFASAVSSIDFIYFSPLALANIVLISILAYFLLVASQNAGIFRDLGIFKILVFFYFAIFLSAAGSLIYAVTAVGERNIYILSLGLPQQYDFVFFLVGLLYILTIACVLLAIVSRKQKGSHLILSSTIISMVLIDIYFIRWGFDFTF